MDASGKTTQLELLKDKINGEFAETTSTEEKRFRKEIEKISKETGNIDLRYIYYKHFSQKISKIAKNIVTYKNKNALKDRGVQTTLAYHRAMGSKIAKNDNLDDIEIVKPDIVFYFDVDKKERIRRLNERGNMSYGDKQLINQKGLLENISAEYKKFENDGRHIRIDTTNKTIIEVHEEVMNHIKAKQQEIIFENSEKNILNGKAINIEKLTLKQAKKKLSLI